MPDLGEGKSPRSGRPLPRTLVAMAQDRISCQVSIPAKVMLFGEYSVLSGGEALSITPKLKMEVGVDAIPSPHDPACLHLVSDLWPRILSLSLEELRSDSDLEKSPLLFEKTAVSAFRFINPERHRNIKISVRSGWEVKDGMGSSSALRLGVWFGLCGLSKPSPVIVASQGLSAGDPESVRILRMIRDEQENDQGFASGYDLATQFLGGLVRFSQGTYDWPGVFVREDVALSLLEDYVHIFRGGAGAPTTRTGFSHMKWLRNYGVSDHWNLVQQNGVDRLLAFLASGGDLLLFPAVMAAFRGYQNLASQSPVFPGRIGALLSAIPGQGRHWSWKTTGAGGEDALFVFGKARDCQDAFRLLSSEGWTRLGSGFSMDGLRMSRRVLQGLEFRGGGCHGQGI